MKQAIIVCVPDGYANSAKPNQLKSFLVKRGYDVELYSTIMLSRLGDSGWKCLLPHPSVACIKLYFLEILDFLGKMQGAARLKKITNSLVLRRICELRAAILKGKLSGRTIDLLICENNFDEAVMLQRLARVQILDSPTPFAEELLYGDEVTPAFYETFKEFEKKIYAAADYLSFHWYTYGEFVRKNKYNGSNMIDIGFGAIPQNKKAHYSEKPTIVFLGFLGGYWVNRPLLQSLSRLYSIDIYGGPRIPCLDLNYKRNISNLDVLADYQFGLITITDDPLRRIGFSAKHLDYFAYGLPVLVPDWRHDPRLAAGSIPYNEANFLDVVREYSRYDRWTEKSNAAFAIAESLSIDNVLKPLEAIL